MVDPDTRTEPLSRDLPGSKRAGPRVRPGCCHADSCHRVLFADLPLCCACPRRAAAHSDGHLTFMTNRGWSRDPVAVASMGLIVLLAAAWTLYGLYGERLVSAMYAHKAISFLRVGAHIRAQRTISDPLHDIEDGLVAVTALCSGLVVFLLFRRRKMQSSTDATPRLQSQAGIG